VQPAPARENELTLLLDEGRLSELRELSDGSDDLLRELADIFLRDSAPRIATLRDAVAAGDMHTVRMIAHVLKGASRNLGASQLADYCQTLELAAKSDSIVVAGGAVQAIESECERVRTALLEFTHREGIHE
jgi:HPt (histidine-containing phosphotransfer) domain-containing protein